MDYLRFVLALMIVLGLILLLGALFRKLLMSGSLLSGTFLLSNKRGQAQKQRIEIRESRILDTRRRLVVLSDGGFDYLLMLTNNGDMLLDKRAQNRDENNDEMQGSQHVSQNDKDKGDVSLINRTHSRVRKSSQKEKLTRK